MIDTQQVTVGVDQVGLRADKALSDLLPDFSRARLQALIADGCVQLNKQVLSSASRKVQEGDVFDVELPPLEEPMPQPEDIPLDVVFEDEHMLVINKAAGMVVHPGAGNYEGTLVNALLHHCGDSLSGIGGVARPGIVHRLDKDTSGLMVVAKHDQAHNGLAAQLADRSLSRVYAALVLGVPMPIVGTIDGSIGRDPRNRLKMAMNVRGGKAARTHYHVKEEYSGALSLVECKLESGRTHQIRVHMASMKHALIGDPLYGPQPTAVRAALKKAGFDENIVLETLDFPRQALHAQAISFIHPMTQERHDYSAELPSDLSNLLKLLR